jgi:hypothetical protein
MYLLIEVGSSPAASSKTKSPKSALCQHKRKQAAREPHEIYLAAAGDCMLSSVDYMCCKSSSAVEADQLFAERGRKLSRLPQPETSYFLLSGNNEKFSQVKMRTQ